MKCLILAGGFATRLYPLTLHRAKALLEYKGKPVITYIIDRVPPHIPVTVTTNKKFEADFLAWRRAVSRPIELCIEVVTENESKIGAIGAVDFWVKSKGIRQHLLVIAGDNYFEFDLADMIRRFDGKHVAIAVHDVGDKEKACDVARACQVGLVTTEGDRVLRLDEKPPRATSSIISTGIYILPARLFSTLAKYTAAGHRDNLGSFITHLLDRGEDVRAFSFAETWLDIGDEIAKGNVSV